MRECRIGMFLISMRVESGVLNSPMPDQWISWSSDHHYRLWRCCHRLASQLRRMRSRWRSSSWEEGRSWPKATYLSLRQMLVVTNGPNTGDKIHDNRFLQCYADAIFASASGFLTSSVASARHGAAALSKASWLTGIWNSLPARGG
jgi:hypothetical protein